MTGVVLAVLLLTGNPADAPGERINQPLGRLCPVDGAVGDESLMRFREALRSAVRARDVEALRPLVAQDIDSTEQQDDPNRRIGFDAFVESHGLRDRSDYYWRDFERVLSQGGLMQGGQFCAPYFVCQSYWPWGGGTVVVLGESVPAHARPDLSSPVVARLSCDVLRVASGDDLAEIVPITGWQGVHLPSGGVGFIESDFVDSPTLMLWIGKKGGMWKLVLLHGTD